MALSGDQIVYISELAFVVLPILFVGSKLMDRFFEYNSKRRSRR